MSLSPFVLVTLAACWVLPVAFIAVRYGMELYRSTIQTSRAPASRDMEATERSVRVQLSEQYGSAPGNQWGVLHAGSYADVVDSQTSQSVREVELSAPYAEASVRVENANGDAVLRRCSICMN